MSTSEASDSNLSPGGIPPLEVLVYVYRQMKANNDLVIQKLTITPKGKKVTEEAVLKALTSSTYSNYIQCILLFPEVSSRGVHHFHGIVSSYKPIKYIVNPKLIHLAKSLSFEPVEWFNYCLKDSPKCYYIYQNKKWKIYSLPKTLEDFFLIVL